MTTDPAAVDAMRALSNTLLSLLEHDATPSLRQVTPSSGDVRGMSDDMRHAPNCERPGVALERGHSCTVTRCLGCGAITAERNIHPQPKEPHV